LVVYYVVYVAVTFAFTYVYVAVLVTFDYTFTVPTVAVTRLVYPVLHVYVYGYVYVLPRLPVLLLPVTVYRFTLIWFLLVLHRLYVHGYTRLLRFTLLLPPFTFPFTVYTRSLPAHFTVRLHTHTPHGLRVYVYGYRLVTRYGYVYVADVARCGYVHCGFTFVYGLPHFTLRYAFATAVGYCVYHRTAPHTRAYLHLVHGSPGYTHRTPHVHGWLGSRCTVTVYRHRLRLPLPVTFCTHTFTLRLRLPYTLRCRTRTLQLRLHGLLRSVYRVGSVYGSLRCTRTVTTVYTRSFWLRTFCCCYTVTHCRTPRGWFTHRTPVGLPVGYYVTVTWFAHTLPCGYVHTLVTTFTHRTPRFTVTLRYSSRLFCGLHYRGCCHLPVTVYRVTVRLCGCLRSLVHRFTRYVWLRCGFARVAVLFYGCLLRLPFTTHVCYGYIYVTFAFTVVAYARLPGLRGCTVYHVYTRYVHTVTRLHTAFHVTRYAPVTRGLHTFWVLRLRLHTHVYAVVTLHRVYGWFTTRPAVYIAVTGWLVLTVAVTRLPTTVLPTLHGYAFTLVTLLPLWLVTRLHVRYTRVRFTRLSFTRCTLVYVYRFTGYSSRFGSVPVVATAGLHVCTAHTFARLFTFTLRLLPAVGCARYGCYVRLVTLPFGYVCLRLRYGCVYVWLRFLRLRTRSLHTRTHTHVCGWLHCVVTHRLRTPHTFALVALHTTGWLLVTFAGCCTPAVARYHVTRLRSHTRLIYTFAVHVWLHVRYRWCGLPHVTPFYTVTHFTHTRLRLHTFGYTIARCLHYVRYTHLRSFTRFTFVALVGWFVTPRSLGYLRLVDLRSRLRCLLIYTLFFYVV